MYCLYFRSPEMTKNVKEWIGGKYEIEQDGLGCAHIVTCVNFDPDKCPVPAYPEKLKELLERREQYMSGINEELSDVYAIRVTPKLKGKLQRIGAEKVRQALKQL